MLRQFVQKEGMTDVEEISVRSSMKVVEDNVKTMVKEMQLDRSFNRKQFRNS